MNFIEIFDNAVSSEDCKSIVKYFDDHKNEQQQGTVGHKGVVNRQYKDTLEIPGRLFTNMTFIEKALLEPIAKGTAEYVNKYKEIAGHIARWDLENGYNLQKYNPGSAYWIPHTEHSSIASGYRMLVWMIYLNTISDGGGTKFTCYDKTVNAEEGRLVIWPASWTHTHHGCVSPTEYKYIATGWYSFQE